MAQKNDFYVERRRSVRFGADDLNSKTASLSTVHTTQKDVWWTIKKEIFRIKHVAKHGGWITSICNPPCRPQEMSTIWTELDHPR